MLLGGQAVQEAPLAPEGTAWMLQLWRPWRMWSWMAGVRPAAGGTRLEEQEQELEQQAGPEAAAALPLAATALQEEEEEVGVRGAAAPGAAVSMAAPPLWQLMMMTGQPAM